MPRKKINPVVTVDSQVGAILRCPRCKNIFSFGEQQAQTFSRYPNMFKAWSPEEDTKLGELSVDMCALDIADELGRPPSSIMKRQRYMKKPTKTDESKKLARYATEVAERVEKIRALLKWNTPDQVKDGWPDLATLVDEVVHANEMLKGAGDGEQEEEA